LKKSEEKGKRRNGGGGKPVFGGAETHGSAVV
jgi:hypothetical protein